MQIAGEAENEAEHMVGDDIVEQAAHVGELAGMFDQFGEDIMFKAGGGGLDPLEVFRSSQEFGSDLAEEGAGILISLNACGRSRALQTVSWFETSCIRASRVSSMAG